MSQQYSVILIVFILLYGKIVTRIQDVKCSTDLYNLVEVSGHPVTFCYNKGRPPFNADALLYQSMIFILFFIS